MKTLGCSIVLALLAAGCSEKATPEPAANGSSAPGSVVSAALVASVEAPIDRSPISVKVDPEVVKLHAVGHYQRPEDWSGMGPQASSGFIIHPFRDRMVVTRAGQLFLLEGDKLVYQPKAVTTEKVPKGTALMGSFEIRSLTGHFPETLSAEAYFYTFMGRQSSSREGFYVRSDGQWQLEKKDARPFRRVAWTPGALLAMSDDGAFSSVGGGGALPKLAIAPEARSCAGKKSLLEARDLTALPSGETFVVGKRCDNGRFAVERFAAGQTQGVIEELPGAPEGGTHATIVAGGVGAVFVGFYAAKGAPPYLARFDGRAFRAIALAKEDGISDLWATSDGTLFALGGTVLTRIKQDGQLTRFAAPQGRRLSGIWASDANTAYVAFPTDHDAFGVLYGTKPQRLIGNPPAEVTEEKPAAAPEPNPEAKTVASGTAPAEPTKLVTLPEYSEGCEHALVFLYDVSDSSPQGWGFPSTAKALSGFAKKSEIKLVEFVFEGRRKLAVVVPDADLGRAVIEHIQQTMKEEKPTLVCHDALLNRRTIDLP